MSNKKQAIKNMDYRTFMATEGGTKCPNCGRYAKAQELGNLSFNVKTETGYAHFSLFGHLKGFGCNKERNDK